MTDVVVFHNSACSTSRHALETLENAGVQAHIVHYLKTPLDHEQLLELIGKLDDPPSDLVRKDGFFKQLGLAADDYLTPAAVAALLVEHPRLMQRPVIEKDGRAIIGRPKDRVADFIPG